MKRLLIYLIVYMIVFGLFSWSFYDTIEPGYERLHWLGLFVISAVFLLPVLLADLLSAAFRKKD